MTKDIADSIKSLDLTVIAIHAENRELFDELDSLQQELGLVSGDRTFSPFLRHQFISRPVYNKIVHASEVLAAAFDKMALAALEDPEILAELGLSEIEERFARMEPGYPGVCHSSRLDSFVSGEDFLFLEYNGETPAGITDQMQIEKVLNRIPEIRDFLSENDHWMPRPHEKLLDALISGYKDFGGDKEFPSIAIVDWEDVSTYTEFVALKEYFESEGYPTLIVHPDELEYDGRSLHYTDTEVDVFYKRVLIHELFEHAHESHPILRAYEDGNLFMANSFRSKIPHKKASFGVLGNERFEGLFTSQEKEIIDRHLPWTRRVSDRQTRYKGQSVELLEFIRRERSRFILKPNDDYGGAGITVGWESTESEWDDAIAAALATPFVVQERVAVNKEPFPTYDGGRAFMADLLIDLDPFIFRGKVEGALVRLSPQTLVNVAAGGGETALAVLE
jgi:hypothetical protein